MTSAVQQKRDAEENGDGKGEESVAPPSKKPRFDDEVNRVAEIVLVLSALRRIQGGKPPTELELELIVEAKSKLVEMCQDFNPKDIIGRDAIEAVIEDLGFNCKLKDQRLGFRAPKLTISEKLSLDKRKILQNELDALTYRVLAYLLLGVVWIYSKKVDFLFDGCNRALIGVKEFVAKEKNRENKNVPLPAASTGFFSIALPESFELDAFDLGVLEDFHGGNVKPQEDVTLKEDGGRETKSIDQYYMERVWLLT